jgi:diguanylate cyclase (GGDEF)-like protein
MSVPLLDNQQDRIRAASIRVALGVFSVFAVPVFQPAAIHYLPVLIAYLCCAIAFQFAIKKNVGGVGRVLAGGFVDTAFTTFLVHRMGTQSTPLVASYLVVGMFNAFVAPAWSARVVGGLGTLFYAAVAFAEALHFLPYAPDYPELAAAAPDLLVTTRNVLLLGVLVGVCTWVSDRIARALRTREQQLRVMNARLEELSQRDPLTQLYNRRHFVHRVNEELKRVRRGHPMALVMMDLDGFKHINDRQGHLVGDDLLRRIARTIEDATRDVDVVGRFGGDEFVAMLPDTEIDQATVVADRLVRVIRSVGEEIDPARPVTVSVGVAMAKPEDDVTVLLNAADEGCYRAKQAGGDRLEAVSVPERDSAQFESGPRASQKTG